MPTPNTNTITLIPARGRDYTSATLVREHLKEGRYFIVQDVSNRWYGKSCNIKDLKRAGIARARVRYSRLTKVANINLLEIA